MKQLLLESPRAFVLHPSAFIQIVERETRFELATLALARRCSTTELLPLTNKTSDLRGRKNVPLSLPLCPEALSSRRAKVAQRQCLPESDLSKLPAFPTLKES